MPDLYETLGVERTDDAATIKTAWRKRAQATHPDRDGGDQQEFQAVQQAYDVLSDPERRERYDATGQFTGQVEDKRAMMLAQVADLLMQLIEKEDVEHTDLIAKAISQIIIGSANLEGQRGDHQRKIEKKRNALSRLSGGSDSIVHAMIEGAIRQHDDIITQINGAIERNKEMVELLKEYSYRADPKPLQSAYDILSGQNQSSGYWRTPTA